MSKRLYSHGRIKYWFTYDIDDVCAVFSDKKLHAQTIRTWINKDGLQTLDKGRPILIYGYDLIAFLKKKNTKNKCVTEFDHIFCMKCQDARPVFQKRIIVEQKNRSLHVKGRCRECKSIMCQNYKMDVLSKLKITFTLVDALELYDCEGNTDKTHLEAPKKNITNESGQGCLF